MMKRKINDKWKFVFRIILYTLVFLSIYWFSTKRLHKDSIYLEITSGGDLPARKYLANKENATKSLLFLLASVFLYYYLFKIEINKLEKCGDKVLKILLLFLFQMETAYFSLNSIFLLGSGYNTFLAI